MKENQMPPAVKTAYKDLERETKIPVWNFAGIGVFILLIAYGSIASGETAKKEEAYLSQPAQGDLYEVRVDGNYTTFRVESVSADSLLVTWNNYGVTKATGLSQIEKDENYGEPVAISRSQVTQMKTDKSIYHIVRHTK